MDIISQFVREQKRYSKKELLDLFSIDETFFIRLVKTLKFHGVLKIVDKTVNQKNLSDLTDEDIELFDIDSHNDDYFYVFTFVGVLTIDGIVIKSFPKYLLNKQEPLDEMKEIIKVLTKFNYENNIINFYSGYGNHKEFNLLSLCLYLINDYYENGIYSNIENIIETNGEGEILWDNTINETFALIIRNKPFYTELKTKNIYYNEMDYFTRLHKCILSDCYKKLEKANLLEIFEMDHVSLSDEELNNFGDEDYIIYMLQKELNVQFSTRKQILLKTLSIYIEKSKAFKEDLGLSMYGTNSFYNVWEKACAEVFDNKLDMKLKMLDLKRDLHEDYIAKGNKTLLKNNKKPTWIPINSENEGHEAKYTLIPDLISIYEMEYKSCFAIFDAKYYNIILDEDSLENHPGVGDVTKQYLYQLAYNDFILKHEFSCVINAFLMPTEEKCSKLIGKVKMDILKGLSKPPLKNILVLKVSASKIFKYYLNNQKLDIPDEFDFLKKHL